MELERDHTPKVYIWIKFVFCLFSTSLCIALFAFCTVGLHILCKVHLTKLSHPRLLTGTTFSLHNPDIW